MRILFLNTVALASTDGGDSLTFVAMVSFAFSQPDRARPVRIERVIKAMLFKRIRVSFEGGIVVCVFILLCLITEQNCASSLFPDVITACYSSLLLNSLVYSY